MTASRRDVVHHDLGTLAWDFADFYRANWASVAKGLTATLGDRDLAVEATDEAMARAYPRWETVRGYDNPAGWVYRVGLNWALSYHRRLRRVITHRLGPEVAEAIPVTDPAVEQALMALSPRHRSVVVCRLLLDWSVTQTAEALGIRPGTVQSRLHRALESLKKSLHHLR